MRKSLPVIALVCALIGIGVYIRFHSPSARSGSRSAAVSESASDTSNPTIPVSAASITPDTGKTSGSPEKIPPTSPSLTTQPTPADAASATVEEAAPTPESTSLPPETILENMRGTIRAYGLRFGGNPVGTNEEITKALSGNNPKQVNFLTADGNRVNAKGELVDAWGTPYFFHQISGTEMEIHSAGPDRIMWTSDDLVTR